MYIYSRYDLPPRISFIFSDVDDYGLSVTQQHFAEECDINHIVKKYSETGFLVDPLVIPTRKPMFGDFSESMTFSTALDKMTAAAEYFDSLPSNIRAEFSNDYVNFCEFVCDDSNRERLVALGFKFSDSVESTTIDSDVVHDVPSVTETAVDVSTNSSVS